MNLITRIPVFWSRKNILFLCCHFITILAETSSIDQCLETRCGAHGPSIHFPFRLKHKQPERCGYQSGFDLFCTDTNQTVLQLPSSVNVSVKSINYKAQVITVSDPQNCFPKQITKLNLPESPFQFSDPSQSFVVFKCPGKHHRNADSRYFTSYSNFSCLDEAGIQVIAFPSDTRIMEAPLLSCTRMYSTSPVPHAVFYENIDTISLSWNHPDCRKCEANNGKCKLKESISGLEPDCEGLTIQHRRVVAILISLLLIFAGGGVLGFYVSNIERQSYKRIKQFLEDYEALKPARYKYADIKRITNLFKDEIGQGAYGTVYKGKLSSKIQVAVKVLNNSTGNGEEFIKEMETMCQIYHVNVVRLVGYCADGFRKALVYDFLPNGSLQKFITSADDKDHFLGWEKLQHIALGIAKGIEYLHQGCDKQILHFDIKPHNILLDNNFMAKISDFGLAKLCAKDQSIVSMTTVKGTRGYMAPEVYSRNFGNVSYKSDVYSFGMLLLEMVGGRKITNVTGATTSEIYYPQWIYNLLENNDDVEIHIEGEGDATIAKKLSIVGLWCIQWHPANRPNMKAVVQMLEGDGGNLAIPPNPFASTTPGKSTSAGVHRKKELSTIFEIE